MTDKAYIVANEQQEHEVLEKLERKGLVWIMVGKKPTEWVPSHDAPAFIDFPIILTDKGRISWAHLSQLDNEEIVFDGRKEEHMSEKYVVSQKFMDGLEEWKGYWAIHLGEYVDSETTFDLFCRTKSWWVDYKNGDEQNKRLIAIIRWVNGEDVFEVEKSKNWIVRSKKHDGVNMSFYVNVSPDKTWFGTTVEKGLATQFDTKEEADKYVNSLTESVQYN